MKKEKGKRRNSGDVLVFVNEKRERETALREKEIEINKRELRMPLDDLIKLLY